MGRIAVICPNCGDIEVTQKEVLVRVCKDSSVGEYLLTCPLCMVIITRRVESRIVELLIASGCLLQTWSLPKELGDEQRSGDEPPICIDDQIDFHDAVHSGDFDKAFDRLCREVK